MGSVVRIDKTLRLDRRERGGRYIRFCWWRRSWGWRPRLYVDAYDGEWWWILTWGPLWFEVSAKPCSWEDEELPF